MFTIRSAVPGDAGRLLEIYDYYVQNTAISFECRTPTPEEFRSRMEKTMRRYPYLVIQQDGIVQGYAYAGPFVGRAAYDWSCEMTIYLAPDARKSGMGRALYQALEDALRKDGHSQSVTPASVSGGGGRVPDQKQRPVPRPPGLPKGG